MAKLPEIDLERAREVWQGMVWSDLRPLRAKLERVKALAAAIESVIENRRLAARAQALANEGCWLLVSSDREEPPRRPELAVALEELVRTLLEARAAAARAAAIARKEVEELGTIPKRERGRPNHAATFVRLMFERDPGLPREVGPWLRLHDHIPFTGIGWKTPARRMRDRQTVAQALRRVINRL